MITLALYDRATGAFIDVKLFTTRLPMRALAIWCNRHNVEAEIIGVT